jgi:hypothetical protein
MPSRRGIFLSGRNIASLAASNLGTIEKRLFASYSWNSQFFAIALIYAVAGGLHVGPQAEEPFSSSRNLASVAEHTSEEEESPAIIALINSGAVSQAACFALTCSLICS